MGQDGSMIVHASAVAVAGRGLLILGPSGTGKSSLALALMASGAQLIADDRTRLICKDGHLIADCPATIRGRIEARHVGLLKAEAAGPVPLVLAVDLGGPLAERLPRLAERSFLGVSLPLLATLWAPELAAALRQALIGGWEP